jgi:hypothetical protein
MNWERLEGSVVNASTNHAMNQIRISVQADDDDGLLASPVSLGLVGRGRGLETIGSRVEVWESTMLEWLEAQG